MRQEAASTKASNETASVPLEVGVPTAVTVFVL